VSNEDEWFDNTTVSSKIYFQILILILNISNIFFFRLNAFLEGFYDIIPKRLISIFNEQELELLISGLPNIDIEDLKSNTEYHKYQVNSIQVCLFFFFHSLFFILIKNSIKFLDPMVLASTAKF
jgi:hypothetical protein